jgi:hypothetical protein
MYYSVQTNNEATKAMTTPKTSFIEKTENTYTPPTLYVRPGQVEAISKRKPQESTIRSSASRAPGMNTDSGQVSSNLLVQNAVVKQASKMSGHIGVSSTKSRNIVSSSKSCVQVRNTNFGSASSYLQRRNAVIPNFQGLSSNGNSASVPSKLEVRRSTTLPSTSTCQGGTEVGPFRPSLHGTKEQSLKQQNLRGIASNNCYKTKCIVRLL